MERELEDNNKALDLVSDEMDDAEKKTYEFGKAVEKAAGSADDAGGRFISLGKIAADVGAAMAAAFAAIAAAAVSAARPL